MQHRQAFFADTAGFDRPFENGLRELRRTRPDAVVIVSRNWMEFGSRGFGVDYARRLAVWLRSQDRSQRRYPRDDSSGSRIHLMRLVREPEPDTG